MSITGAGGLLWFRDDRGDIAVITGKESKFLSDIVHDIENVPLEELQQVRESNLLAAKNAFKKNATNKTLNRPLLNKFIGMVA